MDRKVTGGVILMAKTSEELLESVVKAIDDKRGQDIVALDMKGISIMSDYNVITHASNNRLINAIAEAVVEAGKKNGYEVESVEGQKTGNWVLVDLGSVIVHIFSQEERGHYQLEGLWSEAKNINLVDWLVED